MNVFPQHSIAPVLKITEAFQRIKPSLNDRIKKFHIEFLKLKAEFIQEHAHAIAPPRKNAKADKGVERTIQTNVFY